MTVDTSSNAFVSAIKYLPYASAYALASGLCYLWGYWNGFQIDILEHIELSSVVKLALVPLAVNVGTAVTGSFMGYHFPLNFSEDKNLRRRQRKIFTTLFYALIFFLINFIAFAMWFGSAWRWLAFSAVGGMLFIVLLMSIPFVKNLTKTNIVFKFVLFTVAALPLHCFAWGAYRGELIREGTHYQYLVSGLDGYEKPAPAQDRLRLIGRAGDYMFFFNPRESEVIMSKLPDGKIFVLKTYSNFSARPLLKKPFFSLGPA